VAIPTGDADLPAKKVHGDILLVSGEEREKLDRYILGFCIIVLAFIVLTVLIVIFSAPKLAGAITAPLIALSRDAELASRGNLDQKVEIKTGDEIETLAESFSRMIRNVRDIAGQKERDRAELQVTANLQNALLPPAFPDREEFSIWGKRTGGFLDFFYLQDDPKRILLVMADMADRTEKGVSAAIFLIIVRTLVKNYVQMGKMLAEVFQELNDQLYENKEGGRPITLFLGEINLESGEIEMVNGGHSYPLIGRKGEGYRYLEIVPGLPLGEEKYSRYQNDQLFLDEGDMIYLYQGLTEAENPEGEAFGSERLLRTINGCGDLPPRELDEAIRKAVAEFLRRTEDQEGMTTLAFLVKKLTRIPLLPPPPAAAEESPPEGDPESPVDRQDESPVRGNSMPDGTEVPSPEPQNRSPLEAPLASQEPAGVVDHPPPPEMPPPEMDIPRRPVRL
jgi:sigma-B regulation protein RsbU (phosphoserine phosphatase)